MLYDVILKSYIISVLYIFEKVYNGRQYRHESYQMISQIAPVLVLHLNTFCWKEKKKHRIKNYILPLFKGFH